MGGKTGEGTSANQRRRLRTKRTNNGPMVADLGLGYADDGEPIFETFEQLYDSSENSVLGE